MTDWHMKVDKSLAILAIFCTIKNSIYLKIIRGQVAATSPKYTLFSDHLKLYYLETTHPGKSILDRRLYVVINPISRE